MAPWVRSEWRPGKRETIFLLLKYCCIFILEQEGGYFFFNTQKGWFAQLILINLLNSVLQLDWDLKALESFENHHQMKLRTVKAEILRSSVAFVRFVRVLLCCLFSISDAGTNNTACKRCDTLSTYRNNFLWDPPVFF